MIAFQSADPDGLLRLIPDGAATVAVIVVVTLFLRFLKEHRQEAAKERSEDRAEFRGRLWSTEELKRRLRRAGLQLGRLWGGFDRRPFRPGGASRLLARARPARQRDEDRPLGGDRPSGPAGAAEDS